jgi:hypothetical protein
VPSHWLERCESSSDCGTDGLTCECGVCVTTCSPDRTCNVSGLDTSCVGPAGAVTSSRAGRAAAHVTSGRFAAGVSRAFLLRSHRLRPSRSGCAT